LGLHLPSLELNDHAPLSARERLQLGVASLGSQIRRRFQVFDRSQHVTPSHGDIGTNGIGPSFVRIPSHRFIRIGGSAFQVANAKISLRPLDQELQIAAVQ
jgi:hypothetical protein